MNGVVLSSDEKTLYANHKDGEYILAFDVQPDGSLKNQRNFGKYKSLTTPGAADPRLAEDNGADGMAIDDAGRVYGNQRRRRGLQCEGRVPRRDSDWPLGRGAEQDPEA